MTAVAEPAGPARASRWRALLASRPWGENLFWSVFLAVFGMTVYLGTNRIVARLPNVGVFCFGWERYIPLVPLFIIPYWSTDLLYFFGPLLCTSRAEVRTLAKRMIFGVSVAAVCFLLFPLQLAFARPHLQGLLGRLFDALFYCDRPVNMAPSLHIVEIAVLWVVYSRHSSGWIRLAVQAWLLLIVASTLLVWQHHVIDVVTGFLLAMLCFYVFPEPDDSVVPVSDNDSTPRNLKVAWRYAAGGAACAAIALALRGWALLLLWPAAALALMAGAYLRCGAAIFRKRGGRLPHSTSIVLLPYLIGDRIAHWHYRGRGAAYNRVSSGIIAGRRLGRREARQLCESGISAVLDLSAECNEVATLRHLPYRNLPVLDLTVPSCAILHDAVDFIRAHASKREVYVHCTMGFSRSACVAAAYLLAEQMAQTPEQAIMMIRVARPFARLGPQAKARLAEFAAQLPRPLAIPAARD